PSDRTEEYYASYAKRRSLSESIVIVSVTIPNSGIESLQVPDIRRVFFPTTE
ncbi:hypothetical protein QBC39DRAFT_270670, partial [Podospora conica]